MTFFNYNYDKALIKKNKIETVSIEMSFADGKSSGKTICYFDKDGLLTRQATRDSSGNTKSEFFFTTNSQNDLISRIQKDYEHNRVDTVIYFKSYDGEKLIKDSSSQLPISFNYEYTKNGKLLKMLILSNFGSINSTKRVTVNKFDNTGRIIRSVETVYQNEKDSTGTIFSDRDIFYDNNGKIEKEVENLNSKYSWMANKGGVDYVYDSSGNLIQMVRANAARYIYTYNKKGLITTKKMEMKLGSDDFIETDTEIATLDKYNYTFRQ